MSRERLRKVPQVIAQVMKSFIVLPIILYSKYYNHNDLRMSLHAFPNCITQRRQHSL